MKTYWSQIERGDIDKLIRLYKPDFDLFGYSTYDFFDTVYNQEEVEE